MPQFCRVAVSCKERGLQIFGPADHLPRGKEQENPGNATDTGQVFKLEDYRPNDYLIPETSLTFRLSPESTRVTAVLTSNAATV